MARNLTPEQALALKLLAQGVPTREVAERLGVTQRTIERWQKRPEFCEVFERSTQTLVSQLSDDWLVQAQTTVESHNNAHQLAINLALKGLKKIEEKLESPDCDIEGIDVKQLNWLSMILDRHLQGQRIAMSLDYLDLNRCGQRLSRSGYVVLDPIAGNKDDEESAEESEDEEV